MDRIIGNHGLDHITEQIFAELDTPSLIQCCCVSKLWSVYASRVSSARQLKYLWSQREFRRVYFAQGIYFNKVHLDSLFPQMNVFIERFINYGSVKVLKLITNLLKTYIKLDEFEAERKTLYLKKTPLIIASGTGNLDCLKLFSSIGYDFNEVDDDGTSVLHAVFQFKDYECESESKAIETAKFLLTNADELKIDLNQPDLGLNRTPMQYACISGSCELVKLFFEASVIDKIDFNFPGGNQLHATAFMFVCAWSNYANYIDVVKLFLEHSKDKNIALNAVDSGGKTALHWACKHGSVEVVQLLLENSELYGINCTILDSKSESILHAAERYQPLPNIQSKSEVKVEMVKLVLKHAEEIGLDVHHRNIEGKKAGYIVQKYEELPEFEKVALLFKNL